MTKAEQAGAPGQRWTWAIEEGLVWVRVRKGKDWFATPNTIAAHALANKLNALEAQLADVTAEREQANRDRIIQEQWAMKAESDKHDAEARAAALEELRVTEVAQALKDAGLLPDGFNELMKQVSETTAFWEARAVAAEAKAALADEYAKSLSWQIIQTQKPLPKREAEFLRKHMALNSPKSATQEGQGV